MNEQNVGQDRIQEQWPRISRQLKRRWHRLMTDDLSYPYGSAEYLASVLQVRYGIDNREALLQVYEFECGL